MNDNVCILIVDDDPHDRLLVRLELERECPQAAIIEAGSREEYNQALECAGFDAVITDYELRWSNGLEVLKEVKSRFTRVPVIMFTATGNEEIAVDAMKNGLDDYIIKSAKHFCRLRSSLVSCLEKARLYEALQEERNLYSSLFLDSRAVMMILDPENRTVLEANTTACRYYGYPSEEMKGKPARDLHLFPPDFLIRWTAQRSVHNEHFVYRHRLANGEMQDVEIHCGPILRKGKTLLYCLVYDQTGIKKAEEALRENQRFLATLISNLPGIAYRCRNDEQWTMEFISDGCLNLTGYLPSELINNHQVSYNSLIHMEDQKQVWETIQAALANKTPFELIYRVFHKNREIRWVWEKGRGVYSDEEELIALEGFINDITEYKKSEAQIQRLSRFPDENPSPVLRVQNDGKIQYANQVSEPLLAHWGVSVGQPLPDTWMNALNDVIEGRTYREWIEPVGDRFYSLTFSYIEGESYINIYGSDITERIQAEQKLKETNQTLTTLIQSSPLAIVCLDLEGRIQVWNPAAENLLGWKAEELLGRSFQIVTGDYTDDLHALREQVLAGRTLHNYDTCRYHKDGTLIDISLSIAPQRDAHGQAIGTIGILKDIRERKRFERQLQEAHELLLEAQAIGKMGHWELDLITKQITWSPQVYILFQRDPALGAPSQAELFSLLSPEEANLLEISTQKAVEQGRFFELDLRLQLPDGRTVYHHLHAKPIRDPEGRFTRLIGTVQDITERKLAERAIAKARDFYLQLLEDFPAMIWRTGPNASSDYFNRTWLSMTGLSLGNALGNGWYVAVHPEDAAARRERYREAFAAREPFQLEYRLRRYDREYRTVLDAGRPFMDLEGKFGGYIGVCFDITDRKNLENQLLQAQKMEAIGHLAGGIAHDFNNLLMVINWYAETVQNSMPAKDPLRADMEEIRKAGDRAISLTRQLLAFSRKQVMQPKILSLNTVLTELQKMLHRLIGEDIELCLELEPDLYSVKADPGQLEQVILNIIVNSRDAMPTGGQLTIETHNVYLDANYTKMHIHIRPGHYIMLAITDTGCGMDEIIQAQIFEPFFTTKEIGRGTGLGLSTVYGIVKQSEGYIWVYSEPGKGTTFKIYLPSADPSAFVEVPSLHQTDLHGNETLMLVEDNDMVRTMAANVLREYGYRVYEAANGMDALQRYQSLIKDVDLLITDVVMPKMNGRELAERIIQLHPRIKTIYMSGYTDNVILHHGILDEGIVFLQKPCTPENILQKIRKVLDGSPGESNL